MYQEYKNKILNFYKSRKRMPSYSEIMSILNFKSKNSVHKIINKMVEDNTVYKDSSGKIIPNNIYNGVQILGLVEAGIPSVADEEILDTISFDDYLLSDKVQSYVLEVKGDSMIEECIKEGDLVIVEKREEAKDGDIVIAEVDGGWTMKYFRKKGNRVYLEPGNKKYKPIYPEYDLKIGAIVTGVIRKY